MDVLLRYADGALRERMDNLTPYLRKVKVSLGRGDAEDQEQVTMVIGIFSCVFAERSPPPS